LPSLRDDGSSWHVTPSGCELNGISVISKLKNVRLVSATAAPTFETAHNVSSDILRRRHLGSG
jgi:hypothetical protein